MLDRLMAAGWPPAVACFAALAVSFGVLLATPPGPIALVDVFAAPLGSGESFAAAYAAGAAAGLGLLTLLVSGAALALLAGGTSGRRRPDQGPVETTPVSQPNAL